MKLSRFNPNAPIRVGYSLASESILTGLRVAITIIPFTSSNGEPFRIRVRGNLNPMAQTVTLQIPELLYQRLINTARATATLAVPTNH